MSPRAKLLLVVAASATVVGLLAGGVFAVVIISQRQQEAREQKELTATLQELESIRTEVAKYRIGTAENHDAIKKLTDESAAARKELRKQPKPVTGPSALSDPPGRLARALDLLSNVSLAVVKPASSNGPAGQRVLKGAIDALDKAAAQGISLQKSNEMIAERAEKLKLAEDAIRLRERALSSQPPASGGGETRAAALVRFDMLIDLARSLAKSGRMEDALKRSDEALELVSTLPPEQQMSHRLTALKARSYLMTIGGRRAEALELMREAHAVAKTAGKNDSAARELEPAILRMLLELGKAPEAEQLARDSLQAGSRDGMSADDLECKTLLALALRKQSKQREAERLEFDLNSYAQYMNGVYGGWYSADWVNLLVERGDIDSADDALWFEATTGFETKSPDRARAALEQAVKLLEAHPTPQRNVRAASYRGWLERTSAKAK